MRTARLRVGELALVLFLAGTVFPAEPATPSDSLDSQSKIVYVTASTAYIDDLQRDGQEHFPIPHAHC